MTTPQDTSLNFRKKEGSITLEHYKIDKARATMAKTQLHTHTWQWEIDATQVNTVYSVVAVNHTAVQKLQIETQVLFEKMSLIECPNLPVKSV